MTQLLHLDNMCNFACCEHSVNVHKELSNLSNTFTQGIYKINDIFYLAVGYGLANITMVEGNDGVIIIDTGESLEMAQNVYKDFRKITDKPIKCIIYTHNHLDHIGGVKAFVSKEQVDNGDVKIYAHRKIMEGVINNASVVGPIINARGISTFGLTLETYTSGHINDGIGPRLKTGTSTFIHPTDFLDDELEINVCNIRLIMKYAPSETEDEILIYFPDYNTVQSADIIMGESYPNIYSIRGTNNRDPIKWYESIDLIRKLRPKHLIPSHGRPLSGKNKVYNMLTAYRDAIQFTHDQTVRYMNKGYTPDELVQVISCLPDNLKNNEWLQEFYGTVKHSVKQIYFAYLGWFQADPTYLDPVDNKTRANNYVKAFGGRSNVINIANNYIDNKDYKWAAEILSYLITIDYNDMIARNMKSLCLRELGYNTKNTNWRNWYLTSAKELDGTINYSLVNKNHGCDGLDIINEIPISMFLKNLCVRLDISLTKDVYTTMGFCIKPNNKLYYLEIRSCIVEFHEDSINHTVDHLINIDENALKSIFLRIISLNEAVDKHLLTFDSNTNIEDLKHFFNYFDIKDEKIPFLALPHII